MSMRSAAGLSLQGATWQPLEGVAEYEAGGLTTRYVWGVVVVTGSTKEAVKVSVCPAGMCCGHAGLIPDGGGQTVVNTPVPPVAGDASGGFATAVL
jgi:hypothetical protein